MVRFLRSDATHLSDEDIKDIINARNTMKRASEIMAKKYKISPRRVYQIWRDNHPPLDLSEHFIETMINESSKMIDESSEIINELSTFIKDDDLKALYERETQRGEKNIERSLLII